VLAAGLVLVGPSVGPSAVVQYIAVTLIVSIFSSVQLLHKQQLYLLLPVE